MAIDFTKPATSDNYSTAFVPNIQANQTALAQWLDSTNTTITGTPPTFAKRYNRTSGQIEEYSGAAWAAVPKLGATLVLGVKLQASFDGSVSSNAMVAGDMLVRRSASTGVVYFGDNSSTYLYHDGTVYRFGATGAGTAAVTPDVNNAQPLGTTALRWSTVNSVLGNFSGIVTATGVAVGGALTGATTGSFSGAVTAVGVNVGGALATASTGSFSGTVTAPTFSGNLSGNVTGNCSGSSGSCTGNSATATSATTASTASAVAWTGVTSKPINTITTTTLTTTPTGGTAGDIVFGY